MKGFMICTIHQMLSYKIKKNEVAGHVARMTERRGACMALVGTAGVKM